MQCCQIYVFAINAHVQPQEPDFTLWLERRGGRSRMLAEHTAACTSAAQTSERTMSTTGLRCILSQHRHFRAHLRSNMVTAVSVWQLVFCDAISWGHNVCAGQRDDVPHRIKAPPLPGAPANTEVLQNCRPRTYDSLDRAFSAHRKSHSGETQDLIHLGTNKYGSNTKCSLDTGTGGGGGGEQELFWKRTLYTIDPILCMFLDSFQGLRSLIHRREGVQRVDH